MSKYSGKVLTVYITPSGARVAEGENKNGTPHITKFFIVGGIEDFFTEIPGEAGHFEVTNMTGLVEAIVEECKANEVTSHRVMVASNCFGINTTVANDTGSGSIKDLLKGDVISNVRNMRNNKQKGSSKVAVDKMQCTIQWGELVDDGKVSRKTTESIGDKFLLISLVQEFFNNGYDVISISDNIGALINFRRTEEATFDSQGKVIFDFDTQIHVLSMRKDLPCTIDMYNSMTAEEILERIDNLLGSTLDTVGRNPKIYFTGVAMEDTRLYSALIDRLETMDYLVYDLFDRPDVDPDTGLDALTGSPVLTADYSVNIAMFMSAYTKNVVSILPSVGFSEVLKKNLKAIAVVALIISLGALGFSGYLAGSRFLEMRVIKDEPLEVGSLSSQISSLESNKTSLQSVITTLTKADTTVLDLINFVEKNQNNTVTIVSIDTSDMLPVGSVVRETVSTTTSGEGEDSVVSGESSNGRIIRQPIIIRGYALTDIAAIAYYDKLFNSGLPVEPVLDGLEKYLLPNGEEVYIFEISLGGVFA